MDLDAIAVFVKVVEAGSFSGAAKLLKMPKTTVSAKVAALERRLGVTLIQRTTRKLHITEAGQNYFHHCAIAIKEIETGESLLMSDQDVPRGRLKITAPADLGHSLLPRIVCEYARKYPETEVELIVTNRFVDLVGEGVDLAIRAGDLKDSSMVARKFFQVHVGLWAAPAYLKKHGAPSHPRELEKHRLVLHTVLRGRAIELNDGREAFVAALRPRVVIDDFETVKGFLLQREGIGWVPDFLTIHEAQARELVPVLPKWHLKFSSRMSFVYPGQKYSSAKVRAFIEIAQEMIPGLLER